MSPRFIGIVVGVISLIWASLFTWTEIIDASPDQFSINSPEMKQRLANCSGNFQQRQTCAEQAAESLQQRGFLVWCEKVALILGPPLALWALTNYANRQRQRAPAAPAQRRTAAGAARGGPVRRVRANETNRGDPVMRPPPDLDQDPPPRAPQPPLSGRGPDAPGDSPVFTGGRREPVRRRDR